MLLSKNNQKLRAKLAPNNSSSKTMRLLEEMFQKRLPRMRKRSLWIGVEQPTLLINLILKRIKLELARST
jgi:hypothetical protein